MQLNEPKTAPVSVWFLDVLVAYREVFELCAENERHVSSSHRPQTTDH